MIRKVKRFKLGELFSLINGVKVKVIEILEDELITNFHLPHSTLLLLEQAFCNVKNGIAL